MTYSFSWHKSEFFPLNKDHRSGGRISDTLYTDTFTNLGNLLSSVPGTPSKAYYYKIFVKNISSDTLYSGRVFITSVSSGLTIRIAKEKIVNDYSSKLTDIPTGYTDNDFLYTNDYYDGVNIGTMSAGSQIGIWLKITLQDGTLINSQNKISDFKISLEGRTS